MSSASAYTNYISDKKLSPIFEVTIRDYVPDREKLQSFSALQFKSTLMKLSAGCPPEIAIYIHGFNKNSTDAKEEFNRIQTSLNDNNYRIPLIGWSWNSNTDYFTAQKNAKDNGPILANFTTEFK